MATSFNHNNFYRLPWNYSDNGISWLEPTTACNLMCKGCYRNTGNGQHKSIQEIQAELEVFKSLRKSDCMSISGGDPLVHPQIVEIVKIIREMGWKPIINTNGLALTETLLLELKKAGVFGFTFHIDTSQERPNVGTKEEELNSVRYRYARMLEKIGGIACSFNSTISEKTISDIPFIIRWAQQYPEIVHTIVFILFRSPKILANHFNVFVNGIKIENPNNVYEDTAWGGKKHLYSPEVAEKIRESDPLYEPSAYLNGTADPSSLKWLIATRVIFNGKIIGYVSPKFQELVQDFYHLFKGRYFSYPKPSSLTRAKAVSFIMGLFDKQMRKLSLSLFRQILKNPINFFKPAYFQSIVIIQPGNIKSDGSQNMCDGCPDITVHEGKLVWSCRLEEMNSYGCFYTFVPKSQTINHFKEPKADSQQSSQPTDHDIHKLPQRMGKL